MDKHYKNLIPNSLRSSTLIGDCTHMGKKPTLLQPPKQGIGLERKQSRKFYQTPEWKKIRKELKKKRRKHHEQIVIDVYKRNPDNTPQDLMEFLESDMPLSEESLKKNRIKVASVLDHKTRIRAGGAKLAKRNLQWVTTEEHARKSGKEAHE